MGNWLMQLRAAVKGISSVIYHVAGTLVFAASRLAGSDQAALRWFAIGRRVLPEFEGVLASQLALYFERKGSLDEALAYMALSVERTPDAPDLRIMFATLLVQGGRPEEAAEQLEIVLEDEENLPEVDREPVRTWLSDLRR